jgi:hypothetical protein
MASGDRFNRYKWVFEQNSIMKTLELHDSKGMISFHENTVLSDAVVNTKKILDIEAYVDSIQHLLEYSKSNYCKNKAAVTDISNRLGKDYGIAFDEYRWLQKQDSSNYVKVCLNVFRNPEEDSIFVDYMLDGNKQIMMVTLNQLILFLKNIPVFKPQIGLLQKELKIDKPHKKVQSVEKLTAKFDNLFVNNSKSYNLSIQTCKSPPDPYAYLLKEEKN